MHFVLFYLHRSHHHHQLFHRHHQVRRLYDAVASLKCVRDRGLDHAVEREKNLRPLLNLKNLIISEPSKSLPLPVITQSKDSMEIPCRPIEFIRRYTSVFEEFLPGGIGIQPHIKLTPEVLNHDKEEQLVYQSVNYKQDLAERLLKLLMVSRINKIPVRVIDWLRWELGLPRDYMKTIVPEFPDYFRLKNESNDVVLELVCWSNELAVSEIEKKRMLPIEFPLKYSTGFEMEKKYKKWVDEWQKLPYISPYENASHLASKSDESDKWAVAVLHEILHLFVGKKVEREVVLALGEYLGLRSRFKMALLQHPGIFYVSTKIRTHTVVLRDGYNRGMLVDKNPLMEMRFKYVQLMNTVKQDPGSKTALKKSSKGGQEDVLLEADGSDEEVLGELDDLSDEESNDDCEHYDDDNDDEHTEKMNSKHRGASPNKRFREGKSQGTALGGRATRNSGDDDDEHTERMNSKHWGALPTKSFKGGKSPSTALGGRATRNSGEDDNEQTERMNSKHRGVSPNKRYNRGKSQGSALGGRATRNSDDDDNDHTERMDSRHRGASPNKRYNGGKSQSTALGGRPTRSSGDDDNLHTERMNSKHRGASPNKRYNGGKSQSTAFGGRATRNSVEHTERMNSKHRGASSPNKGFKGGKSQSTALRGRATRKSGENNLRT